MHQKHPPPKTAYSAIFAPFQPSFFAGTNLSEIELTQWRVLSSGVAFAFEDVPQVPAAGRAGDLGAPAVRVAGADHRAGDLLVEAGPAAAGVEFAGGSVERRAALPALVGALLECVLIFADEGHLGALVEDHALFFRG